MLLTINTHCCLTNPTLYKTRLVHCNRHKNTNEIFCTTQKKIEATIHRCCFEMLSANCPLLTTTCNRMTGTMKVTGMARMVKMVRIAKMARMAKMAGTMIRA